MRSELGTVIRPRSASAPPPLAEFYKACPTLACVDIGLPSCHGNWWQQWRSNNLAKRQVTGDPVSGRIHVRTLPPVVH